MEKYRITFKKSFAKDLRTLPTSDIKKIFNLSFKRLLVRVRVIVLKDKKWIPDRTTRE